MNLIVTPVYKNFEVLYQMCHALDINSKLPFTHILVDDNSGDLPQVKITKNRRLLTIHSDYPERIHKNQLGQAVQLAVDYAAQKYVNEEASIEPTNLFIIESDVVVLQPGWDEVMLQTSALLPKDWLTLDCTSVNENGQVTYPDTVAPRHARLGDLDDLHYAMFQCTLINNQYNKDIPLFSDFPSHFDIMWSRAFQQIVPFGKFYRSNNIKVLHINGGGSSRDLLPKE